LEILRLVFVGLVTEVDEFLFKGREDSGECLNRFLSRRWLVCLILQASLGFFVYFGGWDSPNSTVSAVAMFTGLDCDVLGDKFYCLKIL
jgi:hypothetical protein